MPVSPSTPTVPTGTTVPGALSHGDWRRVMMAPVASPRLSRMWTALTVMVLADVICSFRMTVARPATVSVVFGPGLTATVAPPTFALVHVEDPETPVELAVQLLAMTSAVTTPASALTVATDAELD